MDTSMAVFNPVYDLGLSAQTLMMLTLDRS